MPKTFLDFKASAERWQRYSEEYLKEARLYYKDITKSLLTIATFLLGFNMLWLQMSDVKNFSCLQTTLFIITLINLFLSIFFGLWTFVKVNKYLNEVGRYYEKKSEKMNEHILKTGESFGESYPSEIKDEMNCDFTPWQNYVQIGLVCISFLFSIIFAITFVL